MYFQKLALGSSLSNMELERMFLYAFRMGAAFALDLFGE